MSGMAIPGLAEATARMKALYGENRRITDGNYDIRAEKESAMKIVDWDRTYFMTKYYVS